jgi:hypothetical protein
MIELRHLQGYPRVFKSLTGLQGSEFQTLLDDLLPVYRQSWQPRVPRPHRQRAVGGGRRIEMPPSQQLLLSVVWLRLYPTQEVLGYLFGTSDTTVLRTIGRWLPFLEAAGRDTMRMPDPGRKQRRSLDEVLRAVPELTVIIDSFEQRVQRPKANKANKANKTSKTSKTSKTTPAKRTSDPHYSGKKKQHTLKSQVAIDRQDGTFVAIAPSVPGATADFKLLRQSGLLEALPPGVGAWGDLAYVGLATQHPQGLGATPRRKPRGRERPPEDQLYNRAFARERVVVEHSIGRLRRYQSLNQMDRHHRHDHSRRVIAVAGLVNRQIRHRLPGAA